MLRDRKKYAYHILISAINYSSFKTPIAQFISIFVGVN